MPSACNFTDSEQERKPVELPLGVRGGLKLTQGGKGISWATVCAEEAPRRAAALSDST
jgi:hypothetical protein